jgi:hypothetical protein
MIPSFYRYINLHSVFYRIQKLRNASGQNFQPVRQVKIKPKAKKAAIEKYNTINEAISARQQRMFTGNYFAGAVALIHPSLLEPVKDKHRRQKVSDRRQLTWMKWQLFVRENRKAKWVHVNLWPVKHTPSKFSYVKLLQPPWSHSLPVFLRALPVEKSKEKLQRAENSARAYKDWVEVCRSGNKALKGAIRTMFNAVGMAE